MRWIMLHFLHALSERVLEEKVTFVTLIFCSTLVLLVWSVGPLMDLIVRPSWASS